MLQSPPQATRTCKRCGEIKPLTTKHFKNRGRATAFDHIRFSHECKSCLLSGDREIRVSAEPLRSLLQSLPLDSLVSAAQLAGVDPTVAQRVARGHKRTVELTTADKFFVALDRVDLFAYHYGETE